MRHGLGRQSPLEWTLPLKVNGSVEGPVQLEFIAFAELARSHRRRTLTAVWFVVQAVVVYFDRALQGVRRRTGWEVGPVAFVVLGAATEAGRALCGTMKRRTIS